MEKKFESWSQLPAPATAATEVKKASAAMTVPLPPAVAAFEVGAWMSTKHDESHDSHKMLQSSFN